MSQDSSGEAAHGGSRSSLPGRSRNRRKNRGGRGQNRGSSNRENIQTFKGRVPELKGAVYEITSERNPDRYLKTTKEIITFMASRCTSYTTELIEGLQLTDPQAPTDPDPTDPIAVEKWKLALRQHENRVQVYKIFRSSLYNLVLGQCSDALQDKLKSHRDFRACNQDGIALLTIIKALTHSFEDQLFLPDATATVVREFYGLKQRESKVCKRIMTDTLHKSKCWRRLECLSRRPRWSILWQMQTDGIRQQRIPMSMTPRNGISLFASSKASTTDIPRILTTYEIIFWMETRFSH
jgi:hypothetical protein